jgi:pimeloyl-ACP methyl ester carboxylesterase
MVAARRYMSFTPAHRGGRGSPLVCLHGFLETWRVWDLILPTLERHHQVLAPTLPGHAGGPKVDGEISEALLPDAIERQMDEAGFDRAHLVGSSLGGYVALQLATRGRADSVVAIAPAGGWLPADQSYRDLLGMQRLLQRQAKAAAPMVDSILASPEGRRRATYLLTENFEHIPIELLAHQVLGVANCSAADAMIDFGLRTEWTLQADQIACPVRVIWGTHDKLLPWPRAGARYRTQWLPDADWVVLDDVGHYPQLDVPLEVAELITGFASQVICW